MARVKVLTAFKNKYTGALYAPGDILDITEERIEEIKAVADEVIGHHKDGAVFDFMEGLVCSDV